MEWILPAIVVGGLGWVIVGLATSKSPRSGDSDGGGTVPDAYLGGGDGGNDGGGD